MLALSPIPRRCVVLSMFFGVGCSSPITQYASTGLPSAADLVEGRPAEVLLDDGAVLKFAKVRFVRICIIASTWFVSDTLYGWDFPLGGGNQDSVAVPARHVRTIQQEHFDVGKSVETVVFAAAGVCVAFIGLMLLVFLDPPHYKT